MILNLYGTFWEHVRYLLGYVRDMLGHLGVMVGTCLGQTALKGSLTYFEMKAHGENTLKVNRREHS